MLPIFKMINDVMETTMEMLFKKSQKKPFRNKTAELAELSTNG